MSLLYAWLNGLQGSVFNILLPLLDSLSKYKRTVIYVLVFTCQAVFVQFIPAQDDRPPKQYLYPLGTNQKPGTVQNMFQFLEQESLIQLNPEDAGHIANQRTELLYFSERHDEADSLARKNYLRCNASLGPYHSATLHAMLNIGINTWLSGDSKICFDYLLMAGFLSEHPSVTDTNLKIKIQSYLGLMYEGIDDRETSQKYHIKALKMDRLYGKTHPVVKGDMLRFYGLYLRRYTDNITPVHYFLKAQECFDCYYGKYNFQSVKCLNNMAMTYTYQGNYRKAEETFRESRRRLEGMEITDRISVMMTLTNYGLYLSERKQTDSALWYFHQALHLYFPEIDKKSVFSVPVSNPQSKSRMLLHLLRYHAYHLLNVADRGGESRIKALGAANQCFSLIDKMLFKYSEEIINFENYLNYQEHSSVLYFEAAQTALKIFDHTHDTAYFTLALQRFLKCRNSVRFLGENFVSLIRENFPETIADKILAHNASVMKIKSLSNPVHPSMNEIQQKLAMDMLRYKYFMKNHSHPNLHPIPAFPVSVLQQNLRKDQVLMMMFENIHDKKQTLNNLTVIVINQDSITHYTLDYQYGIHNTIDSFERSIRTRKCQSIINTYGERLFELLLKPSVKMWKGKDLLLLTSLYSSRVAFEALPFEKDPLTGRDLPLILTHQVHNVWSLNHFLFHKDSVMSSPALLAMSPHFPEKNPEVLSLIANRDCTLHHLPMAQAECEEIGKYFPSQLFLNEKATLQAYFQHCEHAGIIHIATHGQSSTTGDKTARLAFLTEDGDTNYTYLGFWDIAQRKHNAHLVVLSACRTAEGYSNSGEGIINLASAYFATGAASVVTNKWESNDYATYKIMTRFYYFLAEGHTRPAALRLAKLEYLRTADEFISHPFFWAGMEYYGSGSQLLKAKPPNHSTVLWVCIPGVILLYALVLKKLRIRYLRYNSVFMK